MNGLTEIFSAELQTGSTRGRPKKEMNVDRDLEAIESEGAQHLGLGLMISGAEVMQPVFALARKIAGCDVTALITGETGTGKELLARAIHDLSPRTSGPFVAFSCANLPETLADDELFGHERGAFTGAVAGRAGRFEAAQGGTLFLDEIGDLPLVLQAKLLRVLQQRTFERVGGSISRQADIRLLCATHRDLALMVRQGSFREDLYYRLNVVQLCVPPLRDRREDIGLLAHHFLRRFGQQFRGQRVHFSPPTLEALNRYDWPGNVRQLENVVQRAVVLAEGETAELWHLPPAVRLGVQPPPSPFFDDQVRAFKRALISRTLRKCGGNKSKAAKSLGMTRSSLHHLIGQLQIEEDGLQEKVEAVAPGSPDPG
jgi:Nif-specific regulatory protein